MAKVLIIDDDSSLQKALRLGLTARGHEVIPAGNGNQGLARAASDGPDVIVLDLGLPDIDGLEVLRRIADFSDVPVIVLSATDAEDRKVAALDEGADDYVTKPFGMAELEARIRSSIRHRQGPPTDPGPPEISVGSIHVDLIHHEVRRGDVDVELTSREFAVLSFLARHATRICTRQMILHAVWGEGYDAEAQYLHAYIYRLRQKLGDSDGTLIRTAPGIGYTLTDGS